MWEAFREPSSLVPDTLRAPGGKGGMEQIWGEPVRRSIYDMTVVVPTIRQQRMSSRTFACSVFCHVLVLLVSATVQVQVMFKVGEMTADQLESTYDKLYHPIDGLCRWRPAGSLPFFNSDRANGSSFLECGGLTHTLMGRVDNLDFDGDGMWTRALAQQTGRRWEAAFSKNVNLEAPFNFFAKQAAQGRMAAQAAAMKGSPSREALMRTWRQETDSFRRIPRAWLEGEAGRIRLCQGLEPDNCGMLEARGALRRTLGATRHEEPGGPWEDDEDRVSECQRVLDSYCPSAFGQLFEIYAGWANEICGDPRMDWDPKLRVIESYFSSAANYGSSEDAITSSSYCMLLTLVLIVWWLNIWQEVRMILTWWAIVVSIPSPGRHELLPDGRIRILGLPRVIKLVTVVFHLVPRTAICVSIASVGSQFLLASDDYTFLILNSVALAFITNVDEMMYRAIVSKRDAELVDACHPVVFDMHGAVAKLFHRQEETVPRMAINMIVVLVTSLVVVAWSYLAAGGKIEVGEALMCLCETRGSSCAGRMILGT